METVQPAGQQTITDIQAVATETADTVIIKATGELNYTSVKQHDPLGVILLFPETSLGALAAEYTPDNRTIRKIIPTLSPDQKNVRVEIGLNLDLPYEVMKNGDELQIVFAREEEITSADDAPVAAKKPNTETSAVVEPSPVPVSASYASGKRSTIERIDFSSQEDGKSQVILGTSYPAEFDVQKISDQTLKVRLHNTRLPEFRKNRPLITTRFESAIDRIDPVQAKDAANTTDIIISLREMVPYRPVQTGNVLTLYFDASSVQPRPVVGKIPDWQQALNQTPSAVPAANPTMSFSQTVQPQIMPENQSMTELNVVNGPLLPFQKQREKEKKYTGQKIALDFYQIDIKNVFKILQQVSGKNYAVDKDVKGEVTISLEKPVPWDQVLDLILQMNGLGKEEKNDIIRIATTATLKKEEEERAQQIAAELKRSEQEQKLEPVITEYIPINYANAEKEIYPLLKDLGTEKETEDKDKGDFLGLGKVASRSRAQLDARNNQLIITSTQAGVEKIKYFISQIDKVTPQVQIEARIVEINDTFNRDIGMSWGASGEDIYKSNLDGQYSYHAAMNTQYKVANMADSDMAGTGLIDFNFTRLDAWGTPIVLDAALKAMEQEGQGKIISSPKILTLDNKKATIRQGLRVPYQTVDENGQINTEFQDVDLSLEVKPMITPDKRVAMEIKTTKNEIVDYTPLGDPLTSTNEATTELLVDDGETIVIGGVVKSDMKNTESGFPILKDIPLLGWLFKTKTTDNSKQELLIFLTPKIVQLEQRNLVKTEN